MDNLPVTAKEAWKAVSRVSKIGTAEGLDKGSDFLDISHSV